MSQLFQSEKQLYDDKQAAFSQIVKILKIENKSIQMVEELKDILRQFIYFQTLFHFISNIFPCFNFINTFIQLFEVVNEDGINIYQQGDLIIRICLDIPSSEVQGNSFLELYNWSQFAKKCTINQNQTKSITKINEKFEKEQFIENEQCKQYKYLIIQQTKFMVCLKKYENQREVIYNNIIKCIPQVQQINSKRTQDNIIKSVESINLLEGTIINNQQNQFATPKQQKQQKFKKDALWFLVSGNGIIEQKISETTTVPISTISEGSLFGEEILFQNLVSEQEDNDNNSSLDNIKQFKEQTNLNLGRFQLRITSKLGKMYCISKEQIQMILPSKIVKDLQKNYIQKFNNRKEILKSQIQCQNQQKFQASEKKSNIRRQFSEILNTSNILNKQLDQRESFMNSQEDIIMKKVIDKKQMLLKLQENLPSKKVFFVESPHSSHRDGPFQFNENQKAERKSSKETQKKPSIQLVIKQQNFNEKKETNQSSINEQQKFFSQENELNINSSNKTHLSEQPSDEKRHLKRKIVNIINQGFDFGTKDKQAEYNKEHAIKMLQLKNGMINPTTKVRHPSLYEKQEKIILKQQQKLQSVSIAKLLDQTPGQQSVYNQYINNQYINSKNNLINITSQRNIGEKKSPFYLTPKESLSSKSARQLEQKFQTSFQNTSSKLLRYNTIDNVRIGTTYDFTLFQNNIHAKSSNLIQRPSDQTKFDEMSIIQYGLNLAQIPNNEFSEKNKCLINKTLNLSNISDNNKQIGFTHFNQFSQQENNYFKSDEIRSFREFSSNKETGFADLINSKSTKLQKSRCFSNIIQDCNCTEEENSMNQTNFNKQGFRQLLRQRTYNSFNELLDISQIGCKNNNLNSQILQQNSQKQINQTISEINSKNFLKKETNFDSQKSQDAISAQITKSNQQSARNTTKISQLLEENERAKSEKKQTNHNNNYSKYKNLFASINFNKIISKSPSFDQINFKQILGNKFVKNEFNEKDQSNQQIVKMEENQPSQASQIYLIRSSANNRLNFNLEKASEDIFNVNGQKIQLNEKYIQIKSSKGEYIRLNTKISQIDDNQNSTKASQDQVKVTLNQNINPRDRKLINLQSSAQSEIKNSQIVQNKEIFKKICLRSSQQFYKSPKNLLAFQNSDQQLQVNTDQSCVMNFKKNINHQSKYQLQRCATQDRFQDNTTDFNSQVQIASSNDLINHQNISIQNKNDDQQQQIIEDNTFGIQNRKNHHLLVKVENYNNQNDFATCLNDIDIRYIRQNELASIEKQQQQHHHFQNEPNQKFNFKSYLLQKAKHNQAIKKKNVNIQKNFEQPQLVLCNQQMQIQEPKKL
ncbi:hypothetical protein ABPG72_021170 [Tetrahymena utriculariae]